MVSARDMLFSKLAVILLLMGAPELAWLSVVSTPPGAGVFVDHEYSQLKTPADMSLAPGRYRIILRKAGYADWEGHVDLKARGYLKVDADLKTGRARGATTPKLDETPPVVVLDAAPVPAPAVVPAPAPAPAVSSRASRWDLRPSWTPVPPPDPVARPAGSGAHENLDRYARDVYDLMTTPVSDPRGVPEDDSELSLYEIKFLNAPPPPPSGR